MLLVKHATGVTIHCSCYSCARFMTFISCQGGWYRDPSVSSEMWVVLSFT